MTTTLLEPDSAINGKTSRDDCSRATSPALAEDQAREERQGLKAGNGGSGCREPRVLSVDEPELFAAALEARAGSGMTEEDTVSILEVLAEMQRIIDRHIDKTERQQGDR